MIYRAFHIVMSGLLLAATTGVMLSKHYCGDELALVAMGHRTLACCDDPGAMPTDCCHDEQEMVQIDEEYETPLFKFQVEMPSSWVHLPQFDLSALFSFAEEQITTSEHFIDPPPLIPDIPVLKQSFQL